MSLVKVVVTRQGDIFKAEIADCPGCWTGGATALEALKNAEDVWRRCHTDSTWILDIQPIPPSTGRPDRKKRKRRENS